MSIYRTFHSSFSSGLNIKMQSNVKITIFKALLVFFTLYGYCHMFVVTSDNLPTHFKYQSNLIIYYNIIII